jgi:glycine oxidase
VRAITQSEIYTDVLVIGAGAVGCAVAAELTEQGGDVVLAGTARSADASRVAAGMIAPVTEVTLDPPARDGAAVLSAGSDLWPAFAERFGIRLRRCGGLLLVRPPSQTDRARLPGESISMETAKTLAPFLHQWDGAIRWLPGECAVDAEDALTALETTFARRGGYRIEADLVPDRDGAWVHSGGRITARHTVLATGWASRGLAGVAAELSILRPIRGQILRTCPGQVAPTAPFVRGPGAYVVPQSDGSAMIGATMEPDVRDLTPSAVTSQALMSAATAFAPGLETAETRALVGLRAATPDALPLVGPSRRAGVLLATGLRRNGWLLAPLVAAMIADYLAGRDPGPHAQRLDPRRFGRL